MLKTIWKSGHSSRRSLLHGIKCHLDQGQMPHGEICIQWQFFNRLEITVFPTTSANLQISFHFANSRESATIPRNPVIAKLFRLAHISENLGYGLRKLKQWREVTTRLHHHSAVNGEDGAGDIGGERT